MAKNSTKQQVIVGLDIGTTKIATVVGYRTEEGLINVIGHGFSKSTGVEYGQIRNIDKTVNGIISSCEEAAERSHQEISEVFVGIAGHHIKTTTYNYPLFRHGKVDPICQQEIDEMRNTVFNVTPNAGEEVIDVIPQRYVIDQDHETTDPVGEMANEVLGTYQVITGKQSEVNKIRYCCEKCQVNPNEIILEPIASALACLTDQDKERGVALVDIGGGTSDLIIFIDGNPVYTKVIALGGNVITKDIATVCNIPEDLAEQVKIKHGTCIVGQSSPDCLITIPRPYNQEPIQINQNYLAQIINSRVEDEILSIINSEIEASGYKNRLANAAGIVLTGGGANLRHIQQLCSYVTGMPTRIGLPEHGFVHTLSNDIKKPNFATALGLLKYGALQDDAEFIPNSSSDATKGNNNNSGNGKDFWGIFKNVPNWIKNAVDNIT